MYGYRIIEDPNLVNIVEDWSDVRSPSRARRRMAKHRQRIAYVRVPKPDAFVIEARREIVMHPDVAAKLRANVDALTDWESRSPL